MMEQPDSWQKDQIGSAIAGNTMSVYGWIYITLIWGFLLIDRLPETRNGFSIIDGPHCIFI